MDNTPHFPGRVRSVLDQPPSPANSADSTIDAVSALSGRDRIVVWGALTAIVVLAWGYLYWLDAQMAAMSGEPAMREAMAGSRPWSAAEALFTFAMWVIMMAGMMALSAAPVLLLFTAMQARRAEGSAPLAAFAFGVGYLCIWIGFSALATAAQWALQQAGALSPDLAIAGSRAGGAILVAAGAWQFTPWKDACLRHCQSPLGFLMTRWRAGRLGALRMGMSHGLYCLGCCWALMCVLFVVGVMNLLWIAILTLFVLLERAGTTGRFLARIGGIALIGAGVLMLAGAAQG
ncbi:MAG: DUF2182 domain-containing protein [Lautropia sp.]